MSCFAYFRLSIAALALILVLTPTAPGHGAAQAVVLPSPAALVELLTSTTRPPHDYYGLTARLKLHTTTPINPYVSATPVDYPIGHVDHFAIANNDFSGYHQVAAMIAIKTPHAYFYVQQGLKINMQQLARSANSFEQHIYHADHALFGTEWTPGVDNDTHITIFNGTLPSSAGGYFEAADLFPRSVNPFSNQRKMIYMQMSAAPPGSDQYASILAHEFQHMIHFHMHPSDEIWTNEGSSVLAQVLNGYQVGDDSAKASQPDTQLNSWTPDLARDYPYYGGAYLWMLYLYEHFGGARVTQAVLADSGQSNMALFDDVLAKLGTGKRADDVFADWIIANFLNDRNIDGGRYGYIRSQIHSVVTAKPQMPFTYHGTMHQYAANYLDLQGLAGRAYTLHFNGQPTVPLLGTVAPPQGVWWSNRGDNMTTSLTLPPLDLTRLHHATLRYQAWYDIETDYDYAYVEVSTDGGKTWYAQQTPHTTGTNPQGNNLAEGYTGSSCTPATRAANCWVNEQIDLSRYAGKQILVRFEYVTDDGYNGQSLAIAHLQVPELGFDGDSNVSGWQPAGWLRVGNTLPEHWIVQAMITGMTGTSVVRMPVGADGQGSLSVPAGASHVVVAVSPTAPLTTLTNSYTLNGG